MEPAAIPSRGRFPIPMETAALVDALPRPHRLDLRLYHSSHSPAFLPDSQIFVSTVAVAPTTCSLLLVLYYMSVLVNGRRFLARVLVNGRNSSQWCLGEWSWITPSNHRELWITALLGENRP